MFGIDGFEFLIILIVMIVIVGPRDLPKMMRAFGQATSRMRKTAMEFRHHFDEAMREAELSELSDTLRKVQELDPRKQMTEIFDPIREVASDIKSSLNADTSLADTDLIESSATSLPSPTVAPPPRSTSAKKKEKTAQKKAANKQAIEKS